MKKYFLSAAFVLLSTNAMADRTVTRWGSASDTRPDSCRSAKTIAAEGIQDDEAIRQWSACDCEQVKNGKWSCSVDGAVMKKEVKPTQ
jgi:hypothetical protein